jgi:hypothetical protein
MDCARLLPGLDRRSAATSESEAKKGRGDNGVEEGEVEESTAREV